MAKNKPVDKESKLYLIEERKRLIRYLVEKHYTAADIARIFNISRSRMTTIIQKLSVVE